MAVSRKSSGRSQTSESSSSLGQVRIIGGDFRGRKLPVRSAEGLRPTPDRVRETLFNWLQFEIAGAVCCDAFAGSGVLGLEALSRGAVRVDFLESNVANARQLEQNAQTLQLAHADIHLVDSLVWLAKPATQTFDIVFIDPPFHANLVQPTVDLLFSNQWVKAQPDPNVRQAWLFLEQENTLAWPKLPSGWVCYREKRTAQTQYGLFCYQS